MNVVFICSKNKWRSPTAEKVIRGKTGFSCKAAGISDSAVNKVTLELTEWADIIFVMEEKHKRFLLQKFYEIACPIVVLDIPDEYRFMDPELVSIVEESVVPILEKMKLQKQSSG